MTNKAILTVLAAGMGSRYGGLKQIDPLGPNNEILMDYSLYDAKAAGFERVLFIIKEQDFPAFEEAIGRRIGRYFEVQYAFQDLHDLPQPYQLPSGRNKPWGTAHALLAARKQIDAPFAVINADDFYGASAYKQVFAYLSKLDSESKAEALLLNYVLQNTLSEHGHVARGVCAISPQGYLEQIQERTMIKKTAHGAAYSEDEGQSWQDLSLDLPVSMNFWGFPQAFMQEVVANFPSFLTSALATNPLKGEYLLPILVGQLVAQGKLQVACHTSRDQWYGVTYKEDKARVQEALKNLIQAGVYPEQLWQ